MIERVGFLGTGLMGKPMAERLLSAGYQVTAWNRTAEKAAPLASFGAKIAATPSEAVANCDLVCVVLEAGPAVESVLFASGADKAIRKGAVVVDFSSIAPDTAQAHNIALAAQGIGHLDAPVSGGPYGAEAGTLAIMAGGLPENFAYAEPVLQTLGTPILVGPSGTGQIAKLGSQTVVAGAIAAVAEALLLAKANGADPAKVREAWFGGFADSKILRIHAMRMLNRDFRPGGHVRTHRKDLDAAVASAQSAGLDLPLLRFLHATFVDLCDRGLGDADHAAFVLGLEARNRPQRLSDAPDTVPGLQQTAAH
jgi:3-hydroxyisobutyrate dehydrogenase-like beta-hydroxyacid dehydrogenase